MADLPEERPKSLCSVTYCGLDCFAPCIVKNERKELKWYGLLFTLLCSRVVRTEPLDDTRCIYESTLNPSSYYTTVCQLKYDQRTNFVGAKREFVESIKGVDQEYQPTLGYEFAMYVPSPSHMSGVWEIILLTTIINYELFNILNCSKYSDCHAQRVSKQTQYYNFEDIFMKLWLLSTAGHSIEKSTWPHWSRVTYIQLFWQWNDCL